MEHQTIDLQGWNPLDRLGSIANEIKSIQADIAQVCKETTELKGVYLSLQRRLEYDFDLCRNFVRRSEGLAAKLV